MSRFRDLIIFALPHGTDFGAGSVKHDEFERVRDNLIGRIDEVGLIQVLKQEGYELLPRPTIRQLVQIGSEYSPLKKEMVTVYHQGDLQSLLNRAASIPEFAKLMLETGCAFELNQRVAITVRCPEGADSESA